MSKYLPRFAAILTLVLFLTVPALAVQSAQDAISSNAVGKVFQGSEHQDIPWKVNFSPPRLMYQQVYLIQARARIDPVLLKRVSDTGVLHFVLRAQGEDGKWAHGGEYKDYKLPPGLGRETEIEYSTGIYLRPGNYTLNLAVFDDQAGKSSLTRETVRIAPMADDPLSELDTHLASVEFPEGFPQQEGGNERANDGELFPVSRHGAPIPIASPRPVLIDIVLDITKRPLPEVPEFMDRFGRPIRRPRPISTPSIPSYDLEIGRLLQVGSLLAHLAPQTGCVRVSAVDALRMKTILDKEDVRKMDWPRFEEQIGKFNQDTVDVGVLTNKKGPARFMRRYLDELTVDSHACGAEAAHYIIVVSHEVRFPAKDDKLPEIDRERAHFYYLASQVGGSMGDDLGDLLKPVKPGRLSFNSPRDFRKALAKIVADLEAGK